MTDLGLHKWVHTDQPLPGQSTRMYKFDYYSDSLGYEGEDGKRWFILNCSYWFGDWIEEQDESLWEAYGASHRAMYLVREELYAIILLRWS
jgi:hypothetical protein